ncbi:hypothetical protein ACF082_12610 [Streptomyces lydicus]|uniref:hypothetical protein n=1 Tax=Streptomyces lydicus TaxID=47763 RepID=UPI002E2F14FC|nr:hypothetical protein [Streptomyces lydicus]
MHFGVTTPLDNAPAARSGHLLAPPDRPREAAERALPDAGPDRAAPPASAAAAR